jgi:hypothetical protein
MADRDLAMQIPNQDTGGPMKRSRPASWRQLARLFRKKADGGGLGLGGRRPFTVVKERF